MPEVLTVFRSRLRDDAYDNGYEARADQMLAAAQSMPGFVEFKSYTAADDERVSVIVFDSHEAQQAWATHAEHLAAQRQGIDEFYSEYRITVAEVVRKHSFVIQ